MAVLTALDTLRTLSTGLAVTDPSGSRAAEGVRFAACSGPAERPKCFFLTGFRRNSIIDAECGLFVISRTVGKGLERFPAVFSTRLVGSETSRLRNQHAGAARRAGSGNVRLGGMTCSRVPYADTRAEDGS